MKHGYYRKALESFCIIQPTPLLAARDLMYAHAQLEVESRLIEKRKTSPQAVEELPDLGDRLWSSDIQHVQDGTVSVVDKEAGARETAEPAFLRTSVHKSSLKRGCSDDHAADDGREHDRVS